MKRHRFGLCWWIFVILPLNILFSAEASNKVNTINLLPWGNFECLPANQIFPIAPYQGHINRKSLSGERHTGKYALQLSLLRLPAIETIYGIKLQTVPFPMVKARPYVIRIFCRVTREAVIKLSLIYKDKTIASNIASAGDNYAPMIIKFTPLFTGQCFLTIRVKARERAVCFFDDLEVSYELEKPTTLPFFNWSLTTDQDAHLFESGKEVTLFLNAFLDTRRALKAEQFSKTIEGSIKHTADDYQRTEKVTLSFFKSNTAEEKIVFKNMNPGSYLARFQSTYPSGKIKRELRFTVLPDLTSVDSSIFGFFGSYQIPAVAVLHKMRIHHLTPLQNLNLLTHWKIIPYNREKEKREFAIGIPEMMSKWNFSSPVGIIGPTDAPVDKYSKTQVFRTRNGTIFQPDEKDEAAFYKDLLTHEKLKGQIKTWFVFPHAGAYHISPFDFAKYFHRISAMLKNDDKNARIVVSASMTFLRQAVPLLSPDSYDVIAFPVIGARAATIRLYQEAIKSFLPSGKVIWISGLGFSRKDAKKNNLYVVSQHLLELIAAFQPERLYCYSALFNLPHQEKDRFFSIFSEQNELLDAGLAVVLLNRMIGNRLFIKAENSKNFKTYTFQNESSKLEIRTSDGPVQTKSSSVSRYDIWGHLVRSGEKKRLSYTIQTLQTEKKTDP